MNEQIEEIKNSIRQLMQLISARGQPLSNEMKSQLAKVLDHASNRIQQLRETPPPEAVAPVPIEAPTPFGTELLWHLANGNPEAFVNYLRTVPDPALNQLLSNPEQLTSTIQNLAQRFPQAEPDNIQGVEKAPLNSSNIWGFSYDPQSAILKVRFQGNGIYEYQGVPPYIFKVFQSGAVPAKTSGQNQYGRWWQGKTPSLGASLFALIKQGGYPYQKVA